MTPRLLSPRVLASAIGVSESTLKRWADEGRLRVQRTAGGHRRIDRADAIRFVREQGMSLVRPELLALPGLVRGGVEGDAVAGLLLEALEEDRPEDARAAVLGAYLDGASPAWLCDAVIRSAMERMGELWLEREDGVLVEHRATVTCGRILEELRMLLPEPSADAPSAVGGAFGEDIYRLPSAMVALVLAGAGYRAHDLGPNTPVEATLAAIDRYEPEIVWQSFSVAPAGGAAEAMERIAAMVSRGHLLVGGRAAGEARLPRARNILRLDGMGELAAFAAGRMGGR